MYADDTSIFCAGKTPKEVETKINSDLNKINTWLEANKLTLNIKKTEFLLIASKRELKQFPEKTLIRIGTKIINPVKNNIELTIDEELKWNKNQDNQRKKISQSVAILKDKNHL